MSQMRAVALSAFLFLLLITGTSFAENPERPWLGVVIEEPGRSGGVLVSEVVPGGPADLAGLRTDDLITGLNGEPISGSDDLVNGILGFKVGDKVSLEVESGGNAGEIDVTLEPMPVAMSEHRHGHEQGRHTASCDKDKNKGHSCRDKVMHGGDGCMGYDLGMLEDAKYGKIYFKLKDLRLDADQRAKARAINADFRKKTARAGAELEVAGIELREMLETNPVNLDKVKVKLVEISSKRADLAFLSIKALEDVKKLLTPEQLSEFNGGESCPLGEDRHGSGD